MSSSPPESASDDRNDTPFSTRPLSRRATRLVLIGAFLAVVGGGVGMALFVVDAAEGPESTPPGESTEQVAPVDTTTGGSTSSPGS